MTRHANPFVKLLKDDPRFPLEAYQFVREALDHAQKTLRRDVSSPSAKVAGKRPKSEDDRHLTGQQLCEAIRHYALEQYGFLALNVLRSWRIYSTGHFGDIVYNLIEIGEMKKSKRDRREDFDDVYDFERVFRREFQFPGGNSPEPDRA